MSYDSGLRPGPNAAPASTRSPYARARRSLGLVAAAALLTLLVLAAPSLAARAPAATIRLGSVKVTGATLTITGRAGLPPDLARRRRQAEISFRLTGGSGRAEGFAAKLGRNGLFSVTHTTRLSGPLHLAAEILVSGRKVGRLVQATVRIAAPGAPVPPVTTPVGSTAPGGAPPAGETPTAPQGPTALSGTFDIAPASEVAGNPVPRGSWFEMLDADEANRAPLQNGNSTLANKDYTPLSPGTSGGLETTAYEPAPTPAFSGKSGTKEVGNALADQIMQPQSFFGFNFSVVTGSTDRQTSEADPLPQIIDTNGQLSGQTTAWAVGWNGEWFNQGSPKPNGKLPSGTTTVTGAYNASTGQYTLEWRSAIVGGPFNGFLGSWHLEGTFVPAG